MSKFYIQTGLKGSLILWICGYGETADIRKASVFSFSDAQETHNLDAKKIPWRKCYIDNKADKSNDWRVRAGQVNQCVSARGTGLKITPRQYPIRKEAKTLHDIAYWCKQ